MCVGGRAGARPERARSVAGAEGGRGLLASIFFLRVKKEKTLEEMTKSDFEKPSFVAHNPNPNPNPNLKP